MATAPAPRGNVQKIIDELDVLIRARYPIIYLLTHEENRMQTLLGQLAQRQGKPLYVWTATRGLSRSGDITDAETATPFDDSLVDPIEVLKYIQTKGEDGIYLLMDFHPFLEDPHVVRLVRDVSSSLKASYKNILFSAPRLNLPVELEKDITLLDIPLPDIVELFELLRSLCTDLSQKDQSTVSLNNKDASAIARAAQGLTLAEAENVFSKAVVSHKVIDKRAIQLVLGEKQQLIRKSGILDFFPAEHGLADIGGLSSLKGWLKTRGLGFSQQAADFRLPTPKGVLLLGTPGTGKSLTAKAVANAWQLPLLRLDFGRIFSGLVGSSEENMRRALKVAEGVAPAILWVDELEKGLAGGTSGQSDGGAAARVFGTFLTWMQENTSRVFVVATANRIEALPPELLRRGRFDEIFFVDLPDTAARQEIFAIHLRKKNRDPKNFDLARLAQVSAGFSGAEIEHCIINALYRAFSESRELTVDDLQESVRNMVPLSVTSSEDIRRLRDWAAKRATPADCKAMADKGA